MDFIYNQQFFLTLLIAILSFDLYVCQDSIRQIHRRLNDARRLKHAGPLRSAKDDPFAANSLDSSLILGPKQNFNRNRSATSEDKTFVKDLPLPYGQTVLPGETSTKVGQTAATSTTSGYNGTKETGQTPALVSTLLQSSNSFIESFTLFPTAATSGTTQKVISENVLGATIFSNSTTTTAPPGDITEATRTTFSNKTLVPTTRISAQFSKSQTLTPASPPGNVPNRVKGKPLIMCMPEGIMFFAQTYFEFAGRVFARGRENNAKCVYELRATNTVNVTFVYSECGIPISAKTGDASYQVEVIMSYERENRVQSYLTHCLSQKLRYATEDLPRRIEEALEELNITPVLIESRAPMPQCQMRVIQEETEQPENHKYGPSNGTTVRDAYIGQTLKMEFSLNPASKAFGFLIKNCTVLDKISGDRYTILDNKGCSVDINIFAHPHYDTYTDLALVHWHAFRIPDNSMLSFQCDCIVCSDITDDDGQNGCDLIPTPPICPEVVTSAALQNALLFDLSENQIFKRSLHNLDVNTSVCFSDNVKSCSSETSDNENDFFKLNKQALSKNSGGYCLSPIFFSSILSFSSLLFLVALTLNVYHTLRPILKRFRFRKSYFDSVSMTSSALQRVELSSSIIVESSFTKY